MRLNHKITFLLLFTTIISYSQEILIIDETTRKPVVDVFIYHENKEDISYTNEKGIADISAFPKGLIFMQHPSYHQRSVAYLGNNLNISLKEKIMSFNEVVISANKWEQEEESVSQKIMTINRKTIQFQNPQTSADLLANSGQVFVQKSQLGGGSPKIRGFAANSVLLVVDGVRMNNAIFRSGNLQNVINIDPNALASSEVIFGPGSVIYGSDALGGVMDFHTIEPKWSTDNVPDFSGNALMRYGSAANEQTGHMDFSLGLKKFTFFHSTTFTDFDDLIAGSRRSNGYKGEFERKFYVERINGEDQLIRNGNVNRQKFSGYDLFNTISKIKYRLGSNSDLSYAFYYSTTSDIPRYDNLTQTIGQSDSLANAEWYYGPQKWQMHSLKLNSYKSNKLFDRARLILAYQKFDESRNDRDFGTDSLRIRTEKVDMISAALDLDKVIGKANIYYGIDFYSNDIQSTATIQHVDNLGFRQASEQTRYPNGGSDFISFSLYGSLVYEFSDKMKFNAGLRFNHINLKAKTDNTRVLSNSLSELDLNNSALNGSLGIVYNYSDKTKISYNLSSGFRAPNVDDVGKVFDIGRNLVVPNSNLKPEYSISNEVSYQRKTDRLFFKAVLFYSRLFDAILDGPFILNGSSTALINGDTLNVISRVNAGSAEIYGGSLVLTAEVAENWAISKVISYTGGKDLSNDEPLRHTTPIFGKASLTYREKKLRAEFYIEYNSNRNREDIPTTEIDGKPFLYTANGSPGWYTFNLKSSYQINKHLNVNAGVENILDQHYRPYTSGISAPGRNYILALKANI